MSDRDPGPPLPSPTVENRLACGMFLLAVPLVLVYTLARGFWSGLPIAPYLIALAATAFRVRPAARLGHVYFPLMLLIVLQAACYLLLAFRMALLVLGGAGIGNRDPLLMSAGIASGVAMLGGWVPSGMLMHAARRAELLLVVQLVGPVALFGCVVLIVLATT
jgi:hypothetical protein